MVDPIHKVIITGGGTAGWMAAAMLSKVLKNKVEIQLIESDEIGIIGVGEATIPPIHTFNTYLGIDEKEFLKETKATIKLGIKFENWRVKEESYYHTFGAPGTNMGFCSFQHYWLRAKKAGLSASLWDFDLNYLCCEQQKFNKINTKNPIYDLPYAYHFDAGLYGQFLRKLAEKNGVKRIEGKIKHVQQAPHTGNISALQLENGQQIKGDLFIDCSGQRGLLIKQTMNVPFENWSDYLPADSALAVPTERFEYTLPYTRSIAHTAGWQWRIPLAHRNGNGLVYSSSYLSDDNAHQTLMNNLDSKALDEPKKISFTTGRVTKQWCKNVVSLGLASGFLEPLESTSIHLIQSAIVRLLKVFPNKEIKQSSIDNFNAESKAEFETIADFIILHYHVNERQDSDFWQDRRNMAIPARLQQKIALFKESGAIFNDPHDIFLDASWLQVLLGQGITPEDHHPAAKVSSDKEILRSMEQLLHAKRKPMEQLSTHDDFLKLFTSK